MNDESKFLAFTLKGKGGPDIYAAFNEHPFKVRTKPSTADFPTTLQGS